MVVLGYLLICKLLKMEQAIGVFSRILVLREKRVVWRRKMLQVAWKKFIVKAKIKKIALWTIGKKIALWMIVKKIENTDFHFQLY